MRQRVLLFYVFNWFINSGGGAWSPQHLASSALDLRVEEVSAKAVRLRLSGHATYKGEAPIGKQLSHWIYPASPASSKQKLPGKTYKISYDVRIEGAVEYDPATRKLTRFDAVALGDYRGPWGLSYKEKPAPVGISFQLDRRELGPERRHAPWALSAMREYYWAADRMPKR